MGRAEMENTNGPDCKERCQTRPGSAQLRNCWESNLARGIYVLLSPVIGCMYRSNCTGVPLRLHCCMLCCYSTIVGSRHGARVHAVGNMMPSYAGTAAAITRKCTPRTVSC